MKFALDLKARKEVQRREGSVHFCGDGRDCAGSGKIVGRRMTRMSDSRDNIAGKFDGNACDTTDTVIPETPLVFFRETPLVMTID